MNKTGPETGASILEVIVVLAIAAIIMTAAVTRLGASKNVVERQNIAREFKVYLERARFDSMKRRANVCHEMSRVTILDSTSFSVTTDFNQNGRLDLPGEVRSINLAGGRSDTTILGSGVTLPVTIRFDERGRALLTDCSTPAPPNIPLMYFCTGTCTTATVTDQNSNVLFISATGTIAMMPGSSSAPVFSNPTVTNVATNTQINPRVSVWTETTQPTPTPTPNPSPTVTPSASPVSRDCIGSPFERPAQTGCYCKAPMWIRDNGLCK